MSHGRVHHHYLLLVGNIRFKSHRLAAFRLDPIDRFVIAHFVFINAHNFRPQPVKLYGQFTAVSPGGPCNLERKLQTPLLGIISEYI